MTIKRTLTYQEAKSFYDRLGRREDWQSFYEGPAVHSLLAHGRFETAAAVLEFGCGTGAMARTLLQDHLSPDCRYVGLDISETMIDLTRERIAPFSPRAAVVRIDGRPQLPFPDRSFDRFVSTYVLDLLAEEDITAVLAEAHRLLQPGGRLGLISLTHGLTPVSRLVERAWVATHRWNPVRVGGCRPLNLLPFLDNHHWTAVHHEKLSRFGMSSEVVVAASI